jgi:GDPmannose 4,6-dehydratase
VPRALVTGITGQDGSYLAGWLLQQGYEVVGLVRSPAALDGVRTVGGDLHDPASLRRAVLETAPDELYHLAAPTFVPASWNRPAATLAAIAGATATLLEAAREAGSGMRVLVASSSEIFGDAGESPQHERSPMRPRSPYGVAKLAAHGLVGTLRARDGLHASSAIAFNHESPRRPETFLPRKVTRAAAAIKLGLQDGLALGDLDAVRDWCHARDVVRGAWLMLQQDEPGDYVLASGTGRTVGELAEVAFGCVGLRAADHVRIDPQLVRPPEVTPPVGDPAKARERLGWTTETSFEEMIAEMVQADLAALGAAG